MRRRPPHDPDAAAALLLDFAVIDPAMGSGHFLVGALDYLAAEVGAFLREVPLPAVNERIAALRRAAMVGDALPPTDRQLLRRLLVKHSIFGVDRSAMAVELAKISLWLSSFVPGLPLSVLDANLRHGDSLIGVDRMARVLERVGLLAPLIEGPLQEAVREVATAAARQDTTLDEIADTETAIRAAERAAEPARRLLDAYTAIPFGVTGASDLIDDDAMARSLLAGEAPTHNGAIAAPHALLLPRFVGEGPWRSGARRRRPPHAVEEAPSSQAPRTARARDERPKRGGRLRSLPPLPLNRQQALPGGGLPASFWRPLVGQKRAEATEGTRPLAGLFSARFRRLPSPRLA